MNIARAGHFALTIGDKIFLFGGYDSYFSTESSIECSDGIAKWITAGNLREKRFYLHFILKFDLIYVKNLRMRGTGGVYGGAAYGLQLSKFKINFMY